MASRGLSEPTSSQHNAEHVLARAEQLHNVHRVVEHPLLKSNVLPELVIVSQIAVDESLRIAVSIPEQLNIILQKHIFSDNGFIDLYGIIHAVYHASGTDNMKQKVHVFLGEGNAVLSRSAAEYVNMHSAQRYVHMDDDKVDDDKMDDDKMDDDKV